MFLGTLALVVYNFTKGRSSVSAEVINTYEVQVKQLKEQIAEMREDIKSLTLKVGEQTGIIQEKDRQITQLQEILQNRNPELIEVLQEIRTFMKDLHNQICVIDERTLKTEQRENIIDSGHAVALNKNL